MTVLGVDFGTSHSSIAGCVGEVVRCVPDNGEVRIPSMVYVPKRGDTLVGAAAMPYATSDPHGAVHGIKRVLGRTLDEPGTASLRAGFVHRLGRGPDGSAMVMLRGESFAPVQLVTGMLRHLQRRAAAVFGDDARDVVMTAPVAAPPGYVTALGKAATLAGLRVKRYVLEPVAALVGVGAHLNGCGDILICDFGGGTFDCTIARWDGRVITPVISDGDGFLGGDDFDLALVEGIASAVFQRDKVELRNDVATWSQLWLRCEAAKRALTTQNEAPVTVREAYTALGKWRDIEVKVDRAWAEQRWMPLVERMGEVIRRAIARANLTPSGLAAVVLVGGTSQVPLVQRAVEAVVEREAMLAPHPELAVVTGAAMIGQLVTRGRTTAVQLAEAS